VLLFVAVSPSADGLSNRPPAGTGTDVLACARARLAAVGGGIASNRFTAAVSCDEANERRVKT
jgi:hypothetical protein